MSVSATCRCLRSTWESCAHVCLQCSFSYDVLHPPSLGAVPARAHICTRTRGPGAELGPSGIRTATLHSPRASQRRSPPPSPTCPKTATRSWSWSTPSGMMASPETSTAALSRPSRLNIPRNHSGETETTEESETQEMGAHEFPSLDFVTNEQSCRMPGGVLVHAFSSRVGAFALVGRAQCIIFPITASYPRG